MLAAYRQWDDIYSPRSWVRRVAVLNRSQDYNTEQRQRPHETLPESDRLLTDDAASEIEARNVFLALVRRLPPEQREVMAWTYDGYRPTEIAAELGKPATNIRSLLREARRTLRSYRPAIEETP
jgi:RNA polymerase sigma-70 factor (ECF subfamily)